MRPRRLPLILLALLPATWTGRPRVNAELILDDFDDPAAVVSPAMLNEFVTTENVGPVGARRSIRIFGLQAAPKGRIDINAAGNSAFLASLNELNAVETPLTKIVSVQSGYSFSTPENLLATIDVSEVGQNNAIVFDFQRLTSATEPSFLRVIVKDLSDSYEAVISPPPLGALPFSIVMPFDSFQFRGGGVGLPDFSAIRSLSVVMRVVDGDSPENLDFRMDLGRIRFARIAELPGGKLALIGLAIVISVRFGLMRSPIQEGQRL